MIKAVIFDIYGTLIRLDTGDLDDSLKKEKKLIRAMDRLKRKYGIKGPSKDILRMYVNQIRRVHKTKEGLGISYPEVKIDNIWKSVLRGVGHRAGIKRIFKIAYDFHDFSGERRLYDNTAYLLKELKGRGIKAGIVSNSQFYTEIDMLRLLRRELRIHSIYELFDKPLVFYSYRVGCSKPNMKSFNLLKRRLRKFRIRNSEVLYVGNDMLKDIYPAKKAGFKTCWFINKETKPRKKETRVRPDFSIRNLSSVLKVI